MEQLAQAFFHREYCEHKVVNCIALSIEFIFSISPNPIKLELNDPIPLIGELHRLSAAGILQISTSIQSLDLLLDSSSPWKKELQVERFVERLGSLKHLGLRLESHGREAGDYNTFGWGDNKRAAHAEAVDESQERSEFEDLLSSMTERKHELPLLESVHIRDSYDHYERDCTSRCFSTLKALSIIRYAQQFSSRYHYPPF